MLFNLFEMCTKNQSLVYIREARKFVTGTRMFGNAISTATYAVAEYMANMDGMTIYERRQNTRRFYWPPNNNKDRFTICPKCNRDVLESSEIGIKIKSGVSR